MLQSLWMILGGIVVFLFFGIVWAGFFVLTSWFLEGDNGRPNSKDVLHDRDETGGAVNRVCSS